jgi:uncharacterized membrane protein
MNIKRIFGAILTILGIGGLIYAAVIYAGNSEGSAGIRSLIVFAVLGLIFFVSGIGLIRATKDES